MHKKQIQPNWPLIRKIVQGLFFGLFIYIIWMTKYPLTGFLNPEVLFHLDPLVGIFTSIAERVIIHGLLLSVLTLILTFVFGRVFCGWFCPLGTSMDIMAWIRKKWRHYNESEPSKWLISKYGLLIILFVFSVLGIQLIWFFDPLTIFVRTLSFNIHPFVNGSLDAGLTVLLNWFPDWTGLEVFYYWLKEVLLDISKPHFPLTNVILIIFVTILLAILFQRRFWCRYICPLGALLGTCSRFALLQRQVNNCTNNCGLCRHSCPSNAIKEDNTYLSQECIMCMDCTGACPSNKNSFKFTFPYQKKIDSSLTDNTGGQLSRAAFLTLLGTSFAMTACSGKSSGLLANSILRPPGALDKNHFIDRCIRCGNCMKICPTNVLQPAMLESGAVGIWSPKMNFPASYCEHDCVLCGSVCPTGAIKKLTLPAKRLTKIGLARVNQQACIPWIENTPCLVCEEHCPVAHKAIKIDYKKTTDGRSIGRPVIDAQLCIGCGICENKCPVRPRRAIHVISI